MRGPASTRSGDAFDQPLGDAVPRGCVVAGDRVSERLAAEAVDRGDKSGPIPRCCRAFIRRRRRGEHVHGTMAVLASVTRGAEPVRYERAPLAPAALGDPEMDLASDLLAEERGVHRKRQDQYAARSHQIACAKAEAGLFADELVPLGSLVQDERPRAGMTASRLGRLPGAFRPHGTVTAGNSCGINDGAAVVAIALPSTALPGVRVIATASVGVDPRRPGLGLVPAVRQALQNPEITLTDIDVIEINEAFAGQVLACNDELGLDPSGPACREARSRSATHGAPAAPSQWSGCSASSSVKVPAATVWRPSPPVAAKAQPSWWNHAPDRGRAGHAQVHRGCQYTSVP